MGESEPVPPGYKTPLEWGTQWGLSRYQAERLCKAAVEKGLMDATYLRIISGTVPHKTLFFRDARGKKISK